MKNAKPDTGSSFDDFLREEGLFDEASAKALKCALAEQLEEGMVPVKLKKVTMEQRMDTSGAQLDRVPNPENTSIQLDTLIRAAHAVGKDVEIRLKPRVRRPAALRVALI